MERNEISGSFEMETKMDWDALNELIGAADSDMEFVFDRPWRDRLFSIPWRPWCNVVVYQGSVTGWASNPDGTATVTAQGVGDMGQTLQRR